MNKLKLFIYSFIFFISVPSFANTEVSLNRDNTSGKTTFTAKGWPSALKIIGTAGSPVGKIIIDDKNKTLEGEFELNLDELDTKLSLRNKHMKENYLETEKFPFSKLKLSPIEIDLKKDSSDVGFSGMLTLHGVSQKIQGVMNYKVKGKEAEIKCAFSIKTSDFGIKQVNYMGITVAEEIDLVVELSSPSSNFKESETK